MQCNDTFSSTLLNVRHAYLHIHVSVPYMATFELKNFCDTQYEYHATPEHTTFLLLILQSLIQIQQPYKLWGGSNASATSYSHEIFVW